MQALYPLLTGPKENEASRLPDAGLPPAAGWQKPGEQMFCFSFGWTGAQPETAGEGMSGEKEAHPSGRALGIVRGGGGHSWPSCWLWQMQAPDEVPLSKSLLQHHPAMDSGGVQLPPAGQKFSGAEAGASGRVRLHAVFLHGSEDGREHFCLLGWVGWFFFFFPSSPFKWLPCQPSAVQNFHATSEVLFQLCWLGCHGIFLGGL